MNVSSVQSHLEPSPTTTIGILLGTSWPQARQNVSLAFTRSAEEVRAYFCQADRFGLPPENWLDLFDAPHRSPLAVEQALTSFLDERLIVLQQALTPVRDVLFYYIGYGLLPADVGYTYHLALSCTRGDSLSSSSLSLVRLAEILKTRASMQRRFVLLDCYSPTESFTPLQGKPDQVAIQQIYHEFESKERGIETLPQTGTAFVCAFESSQIWSNPANRLTFSEAMLRTLTIAPESPDQQTRLSLSELHRRTTANSDQLTPGYALEGFLGNPDQSSGKIADIPLFPYVVFHQAGSTGQTPAILPDKALLFAEMQKYEHLATPPPVISGGKPQLVSFVGKTNAPAIQAILSLVLGIISLPMNFAFGPGFPLFGLGGVAAILGIIFSRLGRRSIAHRKIAAAGLTLSLLALFLAVVLITTLIRNAIAIHNLDLQGYPSP